MFKPVQMIRLLLILLPLLLIGCDNATDDNQPAEEPIANSAENAAGSGDILATRGPVHITHQEFDAAISRVPADRRQEFLQNPTNVNRTIDGLLLNKLVASKAREADFHEQDIVELRQELAREEALAKAWLENVAATAPEANYEAIAREQYQADPQKFMTEEEVDVTHILIAAGEERTEDEALALAQELATRLEDNPDQFEELVMEYSDDRSKEQNRGSFQGLTRDEVQPGFARAAFALENVGDISNPAKSRLGYHLIRLDGKQPAQQQSFEDVRNRLILQAYRRHRDRARDEYLATLAAIKGRIEPGQLDELVRRHFPEQAANQFGAPEENE